MAEISLQNYVLRNLRSVVRAHCVKHNDLMAGISDVSADIEGVTRWIELKAVARWPTKGTTQVRLEEYTEEQAYFLYRRHGWLLVRVGGEYFLFNHLEAWEMWLRKGFTTETFRFRATRSWARAIVWRELKEVLWGNVA